MLSVGAVRSKNAKNSAPAAFVAHHVVCTDVPETSHFPPFFSLVLLYVMLDATVGAVAFYLLGYGIAYGDTVDAVTGRNTGNGVIGTRWFALADLPYGEGNSQFCAWVFKRFFFFEGECRILGKFSYADVTRRRRQLVLPVLLRRHRVHHRQRRCHRAMLAQRVHHGT